MSMFTNLVTYGTILCFSLAFWWGVTSFIMMMAG